MTSTSDSTEAFRRLGTPSCDVCGEVGAFRLVTIETDGQLGFATQVNMHMPLCQSKGCASQIIGQTVAVTKSMTYVVSPDAAQGLVPLGKIVDTKYELV